ncbi:hypothetical protein K6L44_16090 [Gluconacetobacter entanii]|uniref:Uncharacterized protein n=1 Tax=Gluconacetobacter entanii TaxID=108528 RepID=A0A318Q9A0_9PROT|nr:hypothetical protein [Gluconacetobacter entanii]MCE2578543.1 hypothetical protein [Komagataeibacter sp. FNDCR1]MBY4641472.1 hypothetical protein [Gluconacetobacter entanii]MCW4581443.1 hypothetical protein [Gluconacetobacter entanii]MCW4584822.1 hypothetical protein [Gluconacetobacter entanii]MCW4588236.1 hypothetical protein [Gluconacetobacter entanii]
MTKPLRIAASALMLSGLLGTGAQALAAPAPAAAPQAEQAAHPTTDFLGPWSSLGLEPVTITAGKASGGTTPLNMKLPAPLEKLTGLVGRTFVLRQVDGTTLHSVNDDPDITFTLTSQNSADLKMKGKKPGQVMNLPLSRAD